MSACYHLLDEDSLNCEEVVTDEQGGGCFACRFDAVIVSSEIGYEKPAAEIFQAALGKDVLLAK